MCTSYKVGREIDVARIFDAEPPVGEWHEEVYKD
jgi:hypothetical protein